MAKRMAKRKRSTPSSADNDSPTTSASNSNPAVTKKRARKFTPIDKILNVAELCEQVLSHLPTEDLPHAMQVCRTFKATIKNSSRLQKNLFLTPDLPRVKFAVSPSGALLSGTRAEQHIAAAEAAGKDTTGDFTCCTLHPALYLDPQHFALPTSRDLSMGMVKHAALHYNPPRLLLATDGAVLRRPIWSLTKKGCRPSSLDNVLITQPPVTSVEVLVACRPGAFASERVSNTTGVNFEDVFRTASGIAADLPYMPSRMWCIGFDHRDFVLSAEAREAAERAGELSPEDDPTCKVLKDGEYVLKKGGFQF